MPEIRFTDDELRSIQQAQQEVVNNFEETFGRFRQWLNEDDMERIKALEASYRPLAKWEKAPGSTAVGTHSVDPSCEVPHRPLIDLSRALYRVVHVRHEMRRRGTRSE
jgi:hypothetical protein